MRRDQLVDYLSRIRSPEFEVIVTKLDVPRHVLSSPQAPQATRATELMQYLQSREQLDKAEALVAELVEPEPTARDNVSGAVRGLLRRIGGRFAMVILGLLVVYLVVVKRPLVLGAYLDNQPDAEAVPDAGVGDTRPTVAAPDLVPPALEPPWPEESRF